MGLSSLRRHYDNALQRSESLIQDDPNWREVAKQKEQEAEALKEKLNALANSADANDKALEEDVSAKPRKR